MVTTLAEVEKKDARFTTSSRSGAGCGDDPAACRLQPPGYMAMAIDLSKCSACNACVIACQSENNIPVVGRDNVRIGPRDALDPARPLLRRPIEDPETVTQPVMCVHCETAPCEYVCP